MYIGVLGPIATNDLLNQSALAEQQSWPKGRAGAPLVSNLIKEYLALGHRVLAITIDPNMDDNEPPFVYTDQQLTFVVAPSRQHTFRPNGKRLGRTLDLFRFERHQMLALLHRYKPDVVHAHWTYEFAMAALSYSPNALITVHDNALTILTYIRTLERVFMFFLARIVFKRGRWFTAVSPYMAQSIGKWVSSKVFVIANPVTLPAISRSPVLSDIPSIGMIVNGWEKRKNSEKGLLAFKVLQRQYPTAILWAMGTAFEPTGDAVDFCRQHDITNVRFLGSMAHADVLGKLAECTLLLHTSLEESFGMVLAEAMSLGVPVVAGKFSGAVPWVVAEGGLLVDVTQVDEIVIALETLLAEPATYRRLSGNAVQIVKSRFSIQFIANQFLMLYQLCNSNSNSSLPSTEKSFS